MRAPRLPIRLDPAYEDPAPVRRLIAASGPYWPVMRYLASESEAASVQREGPARFVIPWFRGDWATGEEGVDGSAPVVHNPNFIEAAQTLFDAPIVRPQNVYVNLMAPLPFSGEPHIDVPAFHGIDRSRHPVWLLHAMGRSQLFRDEQIDIATAVSWFYEGSGGAFDYWSDGTDKPPTREDGPFDNLAIVGDNDVMFHRVAAIGDAETHPLPKGLTLDSLLHPVTNDVGRVEGWEIREGSHCLARYEPAAIRVSVSWKAEVFASGEALERRTHEHGGLELADVVERFRRDLGERGTPLAAVADPLRDPGFIEALTDAYPLPDVHDQTRA